MDFEFDPVKSASHKAARDLDFEQAKALWSDPHRLTLPSAYSAKPRQLVIGKIHEKHWTAVITWREGRIRIISVRRSRDNEKELYEKE